MREGSRLEKGRRELRIYRVRSSEGISSRDSQAYQRQCGKRSGDAVGKYSVNSHSAADHLEPPGLFEYSYMSR